MCPIFIAPRRTATGSWYGFKTIKPGVKFEHATRRQAHPEMPLGSSQPGMMVTQAAIDNRIGRADIQKIHNAIIGF